MNCWYEDTIEEDIRSAVKLLRDNGFNLRRKKKVPLYEYECKKCKKTVEKLLFGRELDEEQLCEKCKKPMHRILSTYSFDIHGYSYKNEYTQKPKPG